MNETIETKILNYLEKAKKMVNMSFGNSNISYTFAVLEIAKMIQLEEHREDK